MTRRLINVLLGEQTVQNLETVSEALDTEKHPETIEELIAAWADSRDDMALMDSGRVAYLGGRD